MNAVYKKDVDSIDGSVSPGVSQKDDQQDDSSLVDIFIKNSKPTGQQQSRSSQKEPLSARQGLNGPVMMMTNELLQKQPLQGEHVLMGKKSSKIRQSSSFGQVQREKNTKKKKEKIDEFMARQNQFEKRKERNLKKLTQDEVRKERQGQNNLTSSRQPGGGKQQKTARAGSSSNSKKYRNLTYDSFEGMKDGVANKKHCDPHSTTTNLALQSINFAGGDNSIPIQDGMNQYLTVMNTHPLLQTAGSNQLMLSSNQHLTNQIGTQPSSFMQNFALPHQVDYYKVKNQQNQGDFFASSGGLPRPYGHTRQISSGRPFPPHQAQAHSAAFAAAVSGEEVLDEFPVPANIHMAPKPTDISIEQRSFLQMQNAINQSSRLDEALGLHYAYPQLQESQNVTNMIMMQALGGHDFQSHPLNVAMLATPMNHLQEHGHGNIHEVSQVEKFFGQPSHKPSDVPSRIGSRAGSNLASHSYITPQANLETTQIMRIGSIQKQNLIQKTQSISTFKDQHALITQPHSSQKQFTYLQNALGEQNIYDARVNNIAKDIDILDSEFAQEESRQIEAYYRSVNKDSDDAPPKQGRGSLNQPRKSSKRSNRKADNKQLMSPPGKGYTKTGSNRSMTERKLNNGVRVEVSRLHQGLNQISKDGSSTDRRSQLSRSSQRSARQINAKAIAMARQDLEKIQNKRKEAEAKKAIEESKKQKVKVQSKAMRDELYLSNKLTRQFIMVTSLVMQSEDLSEDSIFNYAQYTEFAIRFGLMSERAASEESDERAHLYEMWCTLSRVHSDFAFIRVVNLKTMITAILGFPVAIHNNPNQVDYKRKVAEAKAREKKKRLKKKQQTQQQEGTDDDFEEADFDDEVPTENNDTDSKNNEMQVSRKPINIERSAGKATDREGANKEFLTAQTQRNDNLNIQMHQSSNMFSNNTHKFNQNRLCSIIEEQEELRTFENGQLSSPEMSLRKTRYEERKQAMFQENSENQQEEEDDEESEEQRYFYDNQNQEDSSEQETSEKEEQDDEEAVNEYAIDRAHKIGFFEEHFEFCMSAKDVRTVQRRFRLFQKNWREFQQKDLIVKKSVIVDDGITFQPQINKKSEQLIVNKEMGGNLEFPMSNNATTRNDGRNQKRQKIWERDLPRGIKSKERIHELSDLENGGRGDWLTRTEQNTASGLPFSQTLKSQEFLTRDSTAAPNLISGNKQEFNDYFVVGAKEHQYHRTYASISSGKASTNRGPKGVTNPQMTKRMEFVYQIGKTKMLNRQDADKNSLEFQKASSECTFKPQISQSSRELSGMRRSFSKEEKPWQANKVFEKQLTNVKTNQESQNQLAERMQQSIQKDIQRRKQAQLEKQIKDQVLNHGGWAKDYLKQTGQMDSPGKAAPPHAFKNYYTTPQQPVTAKKQTEKKSASRKSLNKLNASKESSHPQLQRYPMTTNTSTQNLQSFPNSQKQYFEAKDAFPENFNNVMSDPVTPVNEFSIEQQNARMPQRNLQSMLQTQIQGSTRLVREQTPNRGMGAAMQHSGDEQGRAPLESQSSLNKTNEKSVCQSSEGNNQMTNLTTPNQTQLLQKAMEELTVIQETTFEQISKGQHAGATSEFGGTSTQTKKPLLFIEVDTNGAEDGGIERIEVYKGDDPRKLAKDFCRKHDYDEGTQIVLQRQIEEKLSRAYAKLDAKMQEKRQNRLAEKFRERQALRSKQ